MPDSTPQTEDRDRAATPGSDTPLEAPKLPEELFPGIIAIAAEAVICVDQEQRIVLFNQSAERIFGYASSEVMGEPLGILLPDQTRSLHSKHVEQFGRSPEGARRMGERGEIKGRRKSGELFPAEASISKLDVAGHRIYTAVLRDISERRRAEAELARLIDRERVARDAAETAERRSAFLADAAALLDASLDYETTLQNLADLVVPKLADVCFIDVIDHEGASRLASAATSLELSHTAHALHQFPRHSDEPYLTRESIVFGRSVLVRQATESALAKVTQHPDHLRLLLALGARSYMTTPLRARGRTLGAMAFIAAGESRAYTQNDLAFAEQLASRAAMAVDNARLYGEAQRATRLRDELLGIVSHDLRNPLSAISMCASALEEEMPAAGESLRYMVSTIAESAGWMNRLIQDLLDMASVEAGRLSIERSAVDVDDILTPVEKMFSPAAKNAGVRLAIGSEHSLPTVMADSERIIQVIANLLANALKFTPSGGEVAVHAEACPDDPKLVRFVVRDSGCGIPPEQLPHVFDRFWQARRGASQRGTGLGLAISKGIVEAHGGTMDAESEVGRGSTFRFTLPAAS
ncbi:MAG TPA: ATP-binding protein [Gemmatimonadaceae bacterium]|nr:ATP-binding protein [Gemmatimonadaceae bacterium]